MTNKVQWTVIIVVAILGAFLIGLLGRVRGLDLGPPRYLWLDLAFPRGELDGPLDDGRLLRVWWDDGSWIPRLGENRSSQGW